MLVSIKDQGLAYLFIQRPCSGKSASLGQKDRERSSWACITRNGSFEVFPALFSSNAPARLLLLKRIGVVFNYG
jgi:hypothetical protein